MQSALKSGSSVSVDILTNRYIIYEVSLVLLLAHRTCCCCSLAKLEVSMSSVKSQLVNVLTQSLIDDKVTALG